MSKKAFKLSDLDFNNIGGWPQQARIVFCVVVGLFIMVLAWFLLISGKRDELESLEGTETQLRTEFETQQGRAVNLEPLKQQLAQMEQVLQQMLRQLPSKTEMPDLIIDISQTALSSGLSNELFQPGPESPKEFYAEKADRLAHGGQLPPVRCLRQRRGVAAARGDPDHARHQPQAEGSQGRHHAARGAGTVRHGQDLSLSGR